MWVARLVQIDENEYPRDDRRSRRRARTGPLPQLRAHSGSTASAKPTAAEPGGGPVVTGETDPGDGPPDDEGPAEGVAIEELLLAEGVVEEMDEAEDLQLTEAFEQAWYRRIEQMSGGDRAVRWLAAIHDVAPDDITVDDRDEAFVVDIAGGRTREWPSEAAFIAGLVVEPTLGEWIPEAQWEELPADARRELSARLLLFLERCPACEGNLEMAEAADDGSVQVSLDCLDCGTTVFEGAYQ